MYSLKDLYDNKANIIDCLNKIAIKNKYTIDYSTIVGSSIYAMYSNNIEDKIYGDLDILMVVNDLSGSGNRNIEYKFNQFNLDIQIINKKSYFELINKNHIFYIESLFTLEVFKLVDNDKYADDFVVNEVQLKETTNKIVSETLNKSKNLFILYAQIFDDMLVVHANKLVWHSLRTRLMADYILENQERDYKDLFTNDFYQISNQYWIERIELTFSDLQEEYKKILPLDLYESIFID